MEDPIRIAAVTKRDALLSAAARLTDFIVTYDELAATQIGNASNGNGVTSVATLPIEETVAPPDEIPPAMRSLVTLKAHTDAEREQAVRRLRGWKTSETENLAAQIIREQGSRQTAYLHAELVRRGHDVGGKSPTATLFSRLSRANSLEYNKLEGWRLKHAPRQTNETAGSELQTTPAASGRDPDQPEGLSPYRAPVNPGGGGGG